LSASSGRNSTTPIRWLAFAVGTLAFVGLIVFMVQQWEEQGGGTVLQIPAGTEFLLAGLVISTIVAALIAKDASRRGMNAFGWFVGVFLLLIVFLPLYLMVRKPVLPQVNEREQLESGAARKCPFCAEIIKIEARVCRFCGRDLPKD